MSETVTVEEDEDGKKYRERKNYEEIMALLFGNVIEHGVISVEWKDLPRITAAFERAGLLVKGDMQEMGNFGEVRPVISVEFKLVVRDVRRK